MHIDHQRHSIRYVTLLISHNEKLLVRIKNGKINFPFYSRAKPSETNHLRLHARSVNGFLEKIGLCTNGTIEHLDQYVFHTIKNNKKFVNIVDCVALEVKNGDVLDEDMVWVAPNEIHDMHKIGFKLGKGVMRLINIYQNTTLKPFLKTKNDNIAEQWFDNISFDNASSNDVSSNDVSSNDVSSNDVSSKFDTTIVSNKEQNNTLNKYSTSALLILMHIKEHTDDICEYLCAPHSNQLKNKIMHYISNLAYQHTRTQSDMIILVVCRYVLHLMNIDEDILKYFESIFNQYRMLINEEEQEYFDIVFSYNDAISHTKYEYIFRLLDEFIMLSDNSESPNHCLESSNNDSDSSNNDSNISNDDSDLSNNDSDLSNNNSDLSNNNSDSLNNDSNISNDDSDISNDDSDSSNDDSDSLNNDAEPMDDSNSIYSDRSDSVCSDNDVENNDYNQNDQVNGMSFYDVVNKFLRNIYYV